MQLLHATNESLKKDLTVVKENISNLVAQDHHLRRKTSHSFS